MHLLRVERCIIIMYYKIPTQLSHIQNSARYLLLKISTAYSLQPFQQKQTFELIAMGKDKSRNLKRAVLHPTLTNIFASMDTSVLHLWNFDNPSQPILIKQVEIENKHRFPLIFSLFFPLLGIQTHSLRGSRMEYPVVRYHSGGGTKEDDQNI